MSGLWSPGPDRNESRTWAYWREQIVGAVVYLGCVAGFMLALRLLMLLIGLDG